MHVAAVVATFEHWAILPGFKESIDSQKQKFAAFGLNTQDLVALVEDTPTIRTSARLLSNHRLYNFTKGGPDPRINPAFVPQLQALCPQKLEILKCDKKLWTDSSTGTFVQRFLGEKASPSLNYNVEFARSMVKMSNIGVKTGTNGDIRRICSAIN
ncbi:peroxidase N1-like [Gossypium arboreum]|uniref:peroxidase N1-like n=1 Tax=Gossypium arboreum TaxID=29729 RepID=UPI0008190391|nr:peroxidase N1-like [Gossypium arboreum]